MWGLRLRWDFKILDRSFNYAFSKIDSDYYICTAGDGHMIRNHIEDFRDGEGCRTSDSTVQITTDNFLGWKNTNKIQSSRVRTLEKQNIFIYWHFDLDHLSWYLNFFIFHEKKYFLIISFRKSYFETITCILLVRAFQLSPDEKFVLARNNYMKQWRHSYFSDYFVYDLVADKERVTIISLFYHQDLKKQGDFRNSLV